MTNSLRPACVLLGLFTLATGIVYPLAVTGVAQLVLSEQANGSLIHLNGRIVGSRLIGQHFDDPEYFWGRPSATAPVPYNASASTGSNLGPSNPALYDAISARVAALQLAHPEQASSPVPVDLVTASGSGLDPDISPAAAIYQIPRIARVRNLSEAALRNLIESIREERSMGLLGEPRVNVLRLNLALDELARNGA